MYIGFIESESQIKKGPEASMNETWSRPTDAELAENIEALRRMRVIVWVFLAAVLWCLCLAVIWVVR